MTHNKVSARSCRRTASAFCALLAVIATGCASGDTTVGQTPTTDPGPLRVSVTGMPANTGIILVEVSGGPVGSIDLAPGYQSVANSVDATHATILVRGALQAGAVATVNVPDRKVSYHVVVIDAAAGRAGGYARRTADQFTLTIAP